MTYVYIINLYVSVCLLSWELHRPLFDSNYTFASFTDYLWYYANVSYDSNLLTMIYRRSRLLLISKHVNVISPKYIRDDVNRSFIIPTLPPLD